MLRQGIARVGIQCPMEIVKPVLACGNADSFVYGLNPQPLFRREQEVLLVCTCGSALGPRRDKEAWPRSVSSHLGV
jgi:hypothetical protein